MRIAYVTDQLLPQNATDTRQMLAMTSALGEAGARVTLVAPARWDRKPVPAAVIAAYYEVVPNFSVATIRSVYPNVRGLEKLAQGFVGPRHPAARRSDLVYTRTTPILIGALLAGRPVAYDTYRPWPDQQPWSRPFFRWLGRQPSFRGLVLHSKLAADSYLRAGVPAGKVLTAHNGYDPSVLEPVRSKEDARRHCGLPVERPAVVYTGRVTLKKGLGLMLDLARALPEVQFVIVGSEGEGPVERAAAPLGNVTVAPWMPVSETAPYLHAADVLLVPPSSAPLRSVGNTVLPLKTYLYMAAGRAILAPRTPDLQELLRDDGPAPNAALVPPDDLAAALHRLRALLRDDALRRRLGAQARRDVQQLTWRRRAERVMRFLDESGSQAATTTS
jgi:glycosyltransferase involved in cell wall biosynthesis